MQEQGDSTEAVIDLVNEFPKPLESQRLPSHHSLFDQAYGSRSSQHYKMIAAKTKLPLILYNIPKQIPALPINETIFTKRIAENTHYYWIKDSSGDIENLKSYLKLNERDDFSILVGSDSLILEAFGMWR